MKKYGSKKELSRRLRIEAQYHRSQSRNRVPHATWTTPDKHLGMAAAFEQCAAALDSGIFESTGKEKKDANV